MDKLYFQLKENINRLTGKCEIGIKVFGAFEDMGTVMSGSSESLERISEAIKKLHSGQYIINRMKAYEAERIREKRLEELKAKLFKGLVSLCDDHRIMDGKTAKMLINGAFLVKSGNLEAVEREFDSIKTKNPGYTFLFSGPWPPYSFINISVKDETQWERL